MSLALLTTLERLTPPERAVYVLREAFGHSHAEVAVRPRRHRGRVPPAAHPGPPAPRDGARAPPRADVGPLLARFVAAARNGDIAGLESLLAADVTVWSDGGGKVSAARRPVHGRDAVARFLVGILGPSRWRGTGAAAEVNGAPALLASRTASSSAWSRSTPTATASGGSASCATPTSSPSSPDQVSRSGGLSGRPS